MPSLPPACPAFSFVSCPHPPAPLPLRGRGIFTFHMQGAPPLASPRLRRRRHGLNLRCRCPLGGLPGWLPADLATVVSAGGLDFLAACLPCLWFTFLPPIPPTPFPGGEGGEYYFISPGATAPGTPALNRLRHLQLLPSRHPAQGACGSPQKRQEAVPYEQCRQPRRGGTGGDGTIRRKRRRCLRWSSPPGQG